MEIAGNGGSNTPLKPGSTTLFGRGQGFNLGNRTVSRRHISFWYNCRDDKVRFEVIGKNPIWKHSKGSGKVETLRPFDEGEMEDGDRFCVCAENPIWFTLKKAATEEESNTKSELLGLKNDLVESLESPLGASGVEELDIEAVDISDTDPIKEFGLIVMGHEFDGYARRIVSDPRKWEWFIEEPKGEGSDDDDDSGVGKRKKRVKRKKKKGEGNDDEEWTGESEEEKELLIKSRKVPKPAYSTRSKDRDRNTKGTRNTITSAGKKSRQADEEDVDCNDEDDETLGGFIVDDVLEEADAMDEDVEDEEEFVDDDLEEE